MLMIVDIEALCEQNGLSLRARTVGHVRSISTPADTAALFVRFHEEAPQVWEKLMSQHTEVPVHVSGTRMSTGSGATDGQLYPSYRALLPKVNAAREAVGLPRVFG